MKWAALRAIADPRFVVIASSCRSRAVRAGMLRQTTAGTVVSFVDQRLQIDLLNLQIVGGAALSVSQGY